MWNSTENFKYKLRIGVPCKENLENCKNPLKIVNFKKSRKSLHNSIRKMHGSLKVLRAESKYNLLFFLKIWANLKLIFFSNEFFNKKWVLAVFRLFFAFWADSAGGIQFSGKYNSEHYSLLKSAVLQLRMKQYRHIKTEFNYSILTCARV